MKRRNRWLSMLLTVTMMTAQLPVSPVMAAGDEDNYEVTIEDEGDEAEEQVLPAEEETVVEDGNAGEELLIEAPAQETVQPGIIGDTAEVFEEDIADPEGCAYVENRVTAVAVSKEEAENIAAAYNARLEYFENGIALIDLEGSGYTVAAALNAYINSNGALPEIEADYIAESALYEEDITAEEAQYAGDRINLGSNWNDMYSSLTDPDPYLNPSRKEYQWHHDMVGTYEAWSMSKGNPDIVVCVVADGTKNAHEDLQRTKRESGIQGQLKSFDKGTPLTGLVGAALNNGKGGAGIAPNVSVITYDANDKNGVVTSDTLATAVLNIANLEYTGKTADGVYKFKKKADRPKAQIILLDAQMHGYTRLLLNTIKAAHDSMNITFVAPAGDYDSVVQCYPASFTQVIAVGAVDANGEKTARSSFGDWVDVAAPGYQLYAPSGRGAVSENLGEYRFVSGTSAAAAVVAGACGLYMSSEGWVKPDVVKKALTDNLKPLQAVSENGVRVAPGKGIISVPEMMGGSELAARISVYEKKGSEYVWKTVNPNDSKASTECPSTGYMKFSALKKTLDKDGKAKYDTELKNISVHYIYTVDGSEPEVTEQDGKFYLGEKTRLAQNGELNIIDLIDKTVRGNQTINLKVKVVNGKGKTEKTTSLKINTVHDSKDIISVNIINQPKTLIAGKSVTLKAEVYYTDENGKYVLHPNQKVKWYINGTHIAKLDQDKGTVKANKGASGELKLLCVADVAKNYADKSGRKEFSINISNTTAPVKKITLNMKKTQLDFDNGILYQVSANDINKLRKPETQDETTDAFSVISINSVVNKDGEEIKDTTAYEWKSSKPAVASIEVLPGGKSVRVTPLKKGTAQISCKAMDGSGKVVKCKVTVKHLVTDMTIKGQSSILRGKKATYKATCTGGYNANGKKIVPNNKKAYWSLLDLGGKPLNISGVTINEMTGKLKVDSSANISGNTDIYVAATTRDRGHYTELYKVTLMGPGVSKATAVTVKFDKETVYIPDYFVPTYKKSSKEDLKGIKLHSLEATRGTTVAGEVILQGFVSNGSTPVWTSSDSKVAGIEVLSQNKVLVRGKNTGKATVTCDAGDGSGKKAKITVNVIVPASNITLIDKKLDVYENGQDVGYSYLAKGGSTQLKANLGAVYGAPTVKKVDWDMEIVAYKRNKAADGTYSIKTYDIGDSYQSILKNQLYKLDKNTGTVSVVAKKTFNDRSKKYGYYEAYGADGFAARIYATTTDGTLTVAARLIVAVDPLEDFRIYNTNPDKAIESYTLLTSNGMSAGMPINYRMGEDRELTSFTARSTDPRVLNGYVEITRKGNEQLAAVNFVVTSEFVNDKTKKEATVELIVTPNDGSGKEAKMKVIVKKQ
ncbi:MAG: S8 family serine peptidase [Lachnospiraceae bacterium]|nr:S8 family serine peptidase [Lachnospiraceae bacterium]